MTPTTENQLKSALAKSHGGIRLRVIPARTIFSGKETFVWNDTGLEVTEREWLQICQDVETKSLTGEMMQCRYINELFNKVGIDNFSEFATWQQRTIALLGIGAISLE